MDWIEAQLGQKECLAGDQFTEADWRFFTTAIRFDPVYYGHFKCNRRHLSDYPRIAAHTQRLYGVEGVAATVNMDHIKRHYYGSQRTLNPSGIVPLGPELPCGD